jgi:hypothetical protein
MNSGDMLLLPSTHYLIMGNNLKAKFEKRPLRDSIKKCNLKNT